MEWLDEMYAHAKNDPWRRECLRICLEREHSFLKIRAGLSPEEQEVLDLYIAACEELSYSLVYSAYAVGKRHSSEQSVQTHRKDL